MEKQIIFGDGFTNVDLPERTVVVSPGVSLPLRATEDLAGTVTNALDRTLDGPPLHERVRGGQRATVAFDDATVPCYAPLWATAIPLIIRSLERGGIHRDDISLVCANALHRKLSHEELAKLLGDQVVAEHRDNLGCHDAEDQANLRHLGTTPSGYDVELNRLVVESDIVVYLNCSTMRGFSGGWKSVCVGLSSYRSIHHHHTPDIMSMSLDRNRMHEILDEMGALVIERLGPERIFKLETLLANPLQVHEIYGGSVRATRDAVVTKLRKHQPARRDLIDEPADVVVYGVPEWSPYAAFSHTNPILDLISTGLGYLGGVIQGVGRPGCTVILASPCPLRWNETHHPSYVDAWNEVLPATRDPDEARRRFEPWLGSNDAYIKRYRDGFAFHPTHAVMALYPLKRLRHASRVIVAGAHDPAVPRHCGFDAASTVEEAIAMAEDQHDDDCSIALVDYPMAANRQ